MNAESWPVTLQKTPDRGRACFATTLILQGTLVYRAEPYNWVICDAYRPEVCARCFKFTGGRTKWKIKTEKGKKWFCSSSCFEESRLEPECEVLEKWLQKLEDEINVRKKRRQKNESKKTTKSVASVPMTDDGKRIGSGNGNIERLTKEERRRERLANSASVQQEGKDTNSGSDDDDFGLGALAINSDDETQGNGTKLKPNPAEEDKEFTPSRVFLDPPTPEEAAVVDRWISCWDDTSAKYALPDDHIPTEDELDVARSVLSALCLRSLDAIHGKASPSSSDPPAQLLNGTPTFQEYLWLQQCEREFYLSLLRQSKPGPKREEFPEAIHRDLRAFRFLASFLPSNLWNPDGVWSEKPSEVFREILFRERANTFGIWEPTAEPASNGRTDTSPESEILGSAVYPTASFFNHSCDPTMYRVQAGRAVEFYTRRTVEVGEELTISYGEISDKLEERRSKLAKEYFFWCACVRCKKEAGEEE